MKQEGEREKVSRINSPFPLGPYLECFEQHLRHPFPRLLVRTGGLGDEDRSGQGFGVSVELD